MDRPFATVSVDVDPVDLHLLGYGFRDLPPDPLAYTAALPRLVDAFTRAGIKATFFVVGRDVAAQHTAIEALARAGHEVASHSLTHPFAFTRLSAERMRHELTESKHLLEQASGATVVGYRSPNFDLDDRSLAALADAGYRYDASGYPTPFLVAARLLLALKSRDVASSLRLRPWPFTFRRNRYRWSRDGRSLEEFPVSVTPGIRFPIYHTPRYLMAEDRFDAMLDTLARRGEALSYPLHAVDAVGLNEDRVDPRLARHPGMDRPLEAKLALLDRTLAAIAARFTPATFAARLDAAEGTHPA